MMSIAHELSGFSEFRVDRSVSTKSLKKHLVGLPSTIWADRHALSQTCPMEMMSVTSS